MSDGEFLVGTELAKKIGHVAGGGAVHCAIAFWSEQGVKAVFPEGAPSDAKIICDISMRSTSAEALRQLGAPNNKKLRHVLGLHAKVILSDRGVVVSSANTSSNALGIDEKLPVNTEAGVFHQQTSEVWTKAHDWIGTLFKSAHQIGDDELTFAKASFQPRRPTLKIPRARSLLEIVCAAPERFAGVGFVFVKKPVPREDHVAIVEGAKDIIGEKFSSTAANSLEVFSGWREEDVKRWPGSFIEFWMPRDRLTIIPCSLEARVPKRGGIVSLISDWKSFKNKFPLPTKSFAQETDAALTKKILDKCGSRLFVNGAELAQIVNKLRS